MNNIDFNTITKRIDVKEYLLNNELKSLVIYSPTSIKKNGINLKNKNFDWYSTNEITKEKNRIDKMFNTLSKYQQIISIGGGTATDIGKYLSNKFNIKLIAIPTMLSTNVYSTNKVALIVDNKVTSIDAIMPTEIYFDNDILKTSMENNLYGDTYFMPSENDPLVKSTSSRLYSLVIYMDQGYNFYTRSYKKIFPIFSDIFPILNF